MITGFLAPFSKEAACSINAGSPWGRPVGRYSWGMYWGSSSSDISASCRSMGNVRCTGPGRPVVAVRKAVATNSGIRAVSWTSQEPLVTGVVMPIWSISWKADIPFWGSSAAPAMKITGLSEV